MNGSNSENTVFSECYAPCTPLKVEHFEEEGPVCLVDMSPTSSIGGRKLMTKVFFCHTISSYSCGTVCS